MAEDSEYYQRIGQGVGRETIYNRYEDERRRRRRRRKRICRYATKEKKKSMKSD
jgi:hypothetical protein